ncbi:DMT family transporter [Georgenia sp. Z1491]|uniref:DMT family transporter n=1 Tax=Georgenia sp. Z1491 TaxID=3416707 RepID=UPI003CF91420
MAVVCAFGATALWGLAFVAPELVATDGTELALGRYLVFGLSSVLVLAARGFVAVRDLRARDWRRIILLGLLGNSLFYSLISAGIVSAGSVPVALVFAVLPLMMAAVGNVRRPVFRWRSVLGPFLLVAAGLAVNAATALAGDLAVLGPRPVLGLVLAVLALLSWLVYGIWNSEYLHDRPLTSSVSWASLTGLGTLITLPAILAVDVLVRGGIDLPAAGDLPALVAWSIVLGIGASWVATWLWARASMSLGASVLGLLIVTEAVFAVLYSCLVDRRLPSPVESLTAALTIGGVAWGLVSIMRARARARGRVAAARPRPHDHDPRLTTPDR